MISTAAAIGTPMIAPARIEMRPTEPVADDGTRRYSLHAVDADVDALDPVLDKIDRDWRSHVTIWRDI